MAGLGQFLSTATPSILYAVRRQPIYDKEAVGGAITQTSFFMDHLRFADGRRKTRSDTNMYLSGMLGVPTKYDLTQVVVYPTRSDVDYVEKYHRFACSDALFRLIIGNHSAILELPMALMKPMTQSPHVRDADTGKLRQLVVRGDKIEVHPVRETNDGPVSVSEQSKLAPRYHIVATRDQLGQLTGRHIDSTMSFRVDIASERYGRMGDEVDVFVAFEGWLWQGM